MEIAIVMEGHSEYQDVLWGQLEEFKELSSGSHAALGLEHINYMELLPLLVYCGASINTSLCEDGSMSHYTIEVNDGDVFTRLLDKEISKIKAGNGLFRL